MNIQFTMGILSLLLILTSGAFHCTRVWQGKIQVNPMSWLVWFGVSFAILISYKSVGATYNYYSAIGNVIFPGINFILSLKQKFTKLDRWDIACCGLGIVSIILWYFTHSTPETVQYANYLAILADLCAIIPTYRLVKSNPMVEKPLPWIVFSIGFGLSIFAITEHTIANYVLPIYMCLGAGVIAFIQVQYRLKTKNTEKWY